MFSKTSSNDQHLPLSSQYIIISIEPEFAENYFVEGKLENFDAVIARRTIRRYFEYYFKDKPP
jgi:hypothetical protein